VEFVVYIRAYAQVFCAGTSVFPLSYHSTNEPCSCIYHGRCIDSETDSVIKQHSTNTRRRKGKMWTKSLHQNISFRPQNNIRENWATDSVGWLYVCHMGLQLFHVSNGNIALYSMCHMSLQLSISRVSHWPIALYSTRVTLTCCSLSHACHIGL
jgi:hypothetical protein